MYDQNVVHNRKLLFYSSTKPVQTIHLLIQSQIKSAYCVCSPFKYVFIMYCKDLRLVRRRRNKPNLKMKVGGKRINYIDNQESFLIL